MAIIAGVIFGLVTALLVAALLQFRGRRGDYRDGPPIHGITWLEVAWTLGPTLIVASIVFFSWGELAESAPSEDVAGSSQRGQIQEDKRLEIGVLGYRYAWDYDIPAYGLKGLKELVVP